MFHFSSGKWVISSRGQGVEQRHAVGKPAAPAATPSTAPTCDKDALLLCDMHDVATRLGSNVVSIWLPIPPIPEPLTCEEAEEGSSPGSSSTSAMSALTWLAAGDQQLPTPISRPSMPTL
mmetsp:Transcript_11030/g.31179  ORF Transcript_11030/g.31179 Transcript_11030/m.31179 type:complete len:120 (-) Transcript_11030:226-585(-)|eukprot:CAMPEP_0117685920 /NCGR_PEP_ID=MMETSP0804-20121206/22086_1 /TAXON_ID=1074897 /ORGANISM="Tetraselmis astigmatica, Strain CCMP880" /LENGTH=119 /DNA_ID=CAMNT_0005497403 /DNA_START=236 /DNA_END=595 /DNA_ORIENTATION=-